MEEISNARKINHAAILEMSRTEGWKILEEMLEYDIVFAIGQLTKEKLQKATNELAYITNLHDIGRARGVHCTAKKYLNLVKVARERGNQ